jgi:hypothetical protein
VTQNSTPAAKNVAGMIETIRAVQRGFIEQHGFKEDPVAPGLPLDVSDGEYPMTLDGRPVLVRVLGGRLFLHRDGFDPGNIVPGDAPAPPPEPRAPRAPRAPARDVVYLDRLREAALLAVRRDALGSAATLLDLGLNYAFPCALPAEAQGLWKAKLCLEGFLRMEIKEASRGSTEDLMPVMATKRADAMRILRDPLPRYAPDGEE